MKFANIAVLALLDTTYATNIIRKNLSQIRDEPVAAEAATAEVAAEETPVVEVAAEESSVVEAPVAAAPFAAATVEELAAEGVECKRCGRNCNADKGEMCQYCRPKRHARKPRRRTCYDRDSHHSEDHSETYVSIGSDGESEESESDEDFKKLVCDCKYVSGDDDGSASSE